MTRSTVRSPTAPEPDHVFDGRALLLAGLDRDHRMDRAAVEIPAQWRQVVPFLDQIPQRRGIEDIRVEKGRVSTHGRP